MLTKQKNTVQEPLQTFNSAYSPPHLSLAPFLAHKDNGYKTYHFAPFSSSSCRALLSSPTSTCLDGNRWGDPTSLAPAAVRTQFGTTLRSRTSRHFVDAVGKESGLVFEQKQEEQWKVHKYLKTKLLSENKTNSCHFSQYYKITLCMVKISYWFCEKVGFCGGAKWSF